LRALLNKGKHAARELRRVRILLQLADEQSPSAIARSLDISENTVYNIRNKAVKHGWQIAITEPRRPGRPQRISGETRAQITALACTTAPAGHDRWSLRMLADRAVCLELVDTISYEGVRTILKKTS